MPSRKTKLVAVTTGRADRDLTYWQQSGNKKILARINRLLEVAQVTPATGIGKPERMKFQEGEVYSRRIDGQHRLVYRIDGDQLVILTARFHYDSM